MPTALISGITGQDGSYLAELLLSKGYEVHGIIRRASSLSTQRIDHIFDRLHLHHGDMTDGLATMRLVQTVQPDEVYNLAAQSHVRVSFDLPDYTGTVDALGCLRLLEAVRCTVPHARFYQASTSEMFGGSPPPQDESTRFHPRSPYACAKAYAHWLTVNYREAHGVHASCGILFNHESPRRGETFVTRKIAKAAARIACGLQDELALGSLEPRRDWGHARDYVRAMWLMLQQDEPDDYVVATGLSHSVRDVLDVAFGRVDVPWQDHVKCDERLYRPSEVDALCGDATKAREVLGWTPEVTFKALIIEMVNAELRVIDEQRTSR